MSNLYLNLAKLLPSGMSFGSEFHRLLSPDCTVYLFPLCFKTNLESWLENLKPLEILTRWKKVTVPFFNQLWFHRERLGFNWWKHTGDGNKVNRRIPIRLRGSQNKRGHWKRIKGWGKGGGETNLNFKNIFPFNFTASNFLCYLVFPPLLLHVNTGVLLLLKGNRSCRGIFVAGKQFKKILARWTKQNTGMMVAHQHRFTWLWTNCPLIMQISALWLADYCY